MCLEAAQSLPSMHSTEKAVIFVRRLPRYHDLYGDLEGFNYPKGCLGNTSVFLYIFP